MESQKAASIQLTYIRAHIQALVAAAVEEKCAMIQCRLAHSLKKNPVLNQCMYLSRSYAVHWNAIHLFDHQLSVVKLRMRVMR